MTFCASGESRQDRIKRKPRGCKGEGACQWADWARHRGCSCSSRAGWNSYTSRFTEILPYPTKDVPTITYHESLLLSLYTPTSTWRWSIQMLGWKQQPSIWKVYKAHNCIRAWKKPQEVYCCWISKTPVQWAKENHLHKHFAGPNRRENNAGKRLLVFLKTEKPLYCLPL